MGEVMTSIKQQQLLVLLRQLVKSLQQRPLVDRVEARLAQRRQAAHQQAEQVAAHLEQRQQLRLPEQTRPLAARQAPLQLHQTLPTPFKNKSYA